MPAQTLTPAIRALMANLIDYAGLFPPAKLPLDDAIRNYARYLGEADAWMLGRFILPAARLGEVGAYKSLFRTSAPLSLSLLGRGGQSADEFVDACATDATDLVKFLESFGTRGNAQVLEVKLPEEVLNRGEAAPVLKLLDQTARRLDELLPVTIVPFFEASVGDAWREAFGPVIAGIAESNRRREAHRMAHAGFKLRCGGVEASAFPPVEAIAQAIVQCRDANVAMKFTAGLHHPLRHQDKVIGTMMHGFVNVFGAAILARENKLSEREVLPILLCENAAEFAFEDFFAWRDLRAGADAIATIRRTGATSYGSCSFDEPREDLRALQLL